MESRAGGGRKGDGKEMIFVFAHLLLTKVLFPFIHYMSLLQLIFFPLSFSCLETGVSFFIFIFHVSKASSS